MSIETAGPSAYDQQYRATILVTLRALAGRTPPTRAVVEEKGREDATIEFDLGGITSRVEVQVKTDKGDFDLASLAKALAHFPSRSARYCLFSRLANDPNSRLLLVVDARAKDETRGLLAPTGELPAVHDAPPLTAAAIAVLAQRLEEFFAGSSKPLEKARARACTDLAVELRTGGRLVDALNRAFVWEQCNDRCLRDEIAATLMLHPFRVAFGECILALGELTDQVRNARDKRGDALPGIAGVLENRRGIRLRQSAIYLDRPGEDALAQHLHETGILALTGHSKSGKSSFALNRLDRLQAEGWLCEVFNDSAAAHRFLHTPGVQNRACLLDDPLETISDDNLAWHLSRLREVGECCGPSRRLIVTARLETLWRCLPGYRPETSGPAGFTWQDMTTRDTSFALRLWNALVNSVRFDATIAARVSAVLTRIRPEELLQPGQLAHLAKSAPAELAEKSDAQLVALARYNAADIAAQLMQRAPRPQRVIAALGFSAGGVAGAADPEIAFVLSQAEERPSWIKDEGSSYPATEIAVGFPTYPSAIRLEQQDLEVGSDLERLGYITRHERRRSFTHPDHAEAFFRVAGGPACQPALPLLERALSCLDPTVVGFAVRMLDAAWSAVAAGSDELQRKLAVRVFRETIFPEVQEIVLRVLLSKLERFPPEEFSELMRSLVASGRVDSLLVWEQETPWLDRHPDSPRIVRRGRDHREFPERAVREICNRLTDPLRASTVKPREADAVNTFFWIEEEKALDADALRRIALFDFSFLRVDATQLLCSGRVSFDPNTAKLFDDPDPRVGARGVQTCFEQWHRHSARGQTKAVIAALLHTLKRLPIAVLSTSFLFDFGDRYSEHGHVPWDKCSVEEIKELWNAWADCMCVVLPTLAPHRLYFKDGDLWTSLREVTKFASPEKLRALFAAWIDWIEVRGKVERLGDYSLAVVRTALESPVLEAVDRETIIQRSLACRRSDAVIESLKALVDLWDDLTSGERGLVTGFFANRRPDHAWLVAAVISRDCPPELVELLTGNDRFYSLCSESVVALLPPPVLRACLGVLCESVPAVGGLHIRAHEEFWHQIWRRMLFETAHADARLLLQDLVFRIGIQMSPDTEPRRRKYVKDFARLCARADEPQRKILFTALMTLAVNSTRPELTECWKLLYTACTQDERERFADIMAEHIEALDIAQSPLGQLGPRWSKLLERRLPSDYLLVVFISAGRRLDMPFSDFLSTVELIYQKTPPRTVTVHDIVLDKLKGMGRLNSDLARRVDQLRDQAFEKIRDKDAFPRPESDLNGWV